MDEEIFDVILLSTGPFFADASTHQRTPPPSNAFHLGAEFWVGRLPKGTDSGLIFDACDPAGLNFHPVRQYGMRYAFCRRVRPQSSEYYAWDSDLVLGITVFLSRLIRPTTMANSLSARLYFVQDQLTTIVPGPTQGLGAHAWVIAKDSWRDWLSVSECEQLRNLLPLYDRNAPERVRLARKHIDHAFHAFYLDQRFASLVTSFESLLKVSRYRSTEQFANRAPRLAERLGLELSGSEARTMYEDRSAFVHGSAVSFSELSDDLIEQYNRFERVIRMALLRASTEPAFADLFASSDAVERAFG